VSERRAKAWYTYPKKEAHAEIAKVVDGMRRKQAGYRDSVIHCMRLRAGTQDLAGDGLNIGDNGRLRYNLAASTVDTMCSIVASSRPMPQTIVRGGDYRLQRQAKLRNRCLIGQALDLELFRKAGLAYDDACTTGLGVLHFTRDSDTGLPTVERRLPLSLVWDRVEAVNGSVRSLYMTDLVPRDVLLALYPNLADKIAKAKGPDQTDLRDYAMTRDSQADQVIVRWAWHLPASSAKRKTADGEDKDELRHPGRHVMCVDTCTLSDVPWTRARFPFAFFRYAPRQVGFNGRSLVEAIRPAQQRIHRLIQTVEENQDFGAACRVFVERGSEIDREQITNLPMGVQTYVGQVPTFNTFDATLTGLQDEIDRIREQTWSQLGLNESQVQGTRNPGLSSGKAIMAQEDIGSRRHAMNLRYFEEAMLECYQALSDLNDDVAEDVPDFEVSARARGRFLESSRWADLQIEDGDVRTSVFPVSSLLTSPSGRYQQLETLVDKGWVPQGVAQQLSGMPDLEAYEDLETADLRLAQKHVGQIQDGAKGVLPIREMDMQVVIPFVRKSLVSATEDDAPDSVLAELDAYLQYARELDKASQPAPLPEALPGMPGPMTQEMPVAPMPMPQ